MECGEVVLGVSEITDDPEFDIENKRLIHLMQTKNDRDAAGKLCEKNSGFIYNIAKKYIHRYGSRAEIEDLMQEGYIGLLRAAKDFDVSSNVTFLTYAYYWISQKIVRCVDDDHMVRMPCHYMEMLKRLIRKDSTLAHLPALERIRLEAEYLNVSEQEVEKAILMSKRFLVLTSTDQPVFTDNFSEIVGGEMIADDSAMPVDEEAISNVIFGEMLEKMNELSPREKEILERRIGIENGVLTENEETLEEIGKSKGVTRERIRQIESKAKRKMRIRLRHYYDRRYW